MRKAALLLLFSSLFLASCEVEGPGEEDYGYNHALVVIDGGKLQFREDCLICHRTAEYEDGEEERPRFRYAGTVWDVVNGIPDSGVRVLLISADNADTIALTTDRYGNIYTDSLLSTAEYRAVMKCGAEDRVMEYRAYYGGCNDCHRPGGKVGRVLSCN